MQKDIVPELLIKNSILDSQQIRQNIARGLDGVPVNRMYEQAQRLFSTILPEIEKKHGLDSDRYQYWLGVYKSLLWSIVVIGRYDALLLRLSRIETLCQFYRDMEEKATRELKKFETLEELCLTDSLEKHIEAVQKRVTELLNEKK